MMDYLYLLRGVKCSSTSVVCAGHTVPPVPNYLGADKFATGDAQLVTYVPITLPGRCEHFTCDLL